ncbi:PAS-domain containing protein [Pseudopelagicola sp. nBUS_20]|uniref:hybrid sensor histidine kinase/response regulator n=1 Tax=Pseudopelagicola sp. nBUS_20 TaxID=3395317 RepID=UPI003EBA0E78
MSNTLIDPRDSLARQNEKLLKIVNTLISRAEQSTDSAGMAYAQFERAVMLEDEVRTRTLELEHALDLLNDSNAQLAQANAFTEEARANLANAIETVQEGFALFDANEALVMCNSRFGKNLRDVHNRFKPGLAFSKYVDLVSKSRFLSLPEEQTSKEWAALRMARHKDNHVVFNARIADKQWLQVSEHRTPDGGTVVLQTDVTDMVLLERQERERLLDDQAQLIRATLEHLNQGVCIFDNGSRLVGWNRRVGELLSIPAGRFHLGMPFGSIYDRLLFDTPRLNNGDTASLNTWAKSETRRAPLSLEIEVGENRTLALFAQQMPDQGFVISFTDISAERAAVKAISEVNETLERRVVERTFELEDALAEAERANASKSRFVAAASHDLLQPLSAAKLYVASLESDVVAPRLKERLAKTSSALQSVEDILGALLDISRLDSGAAAIDISDISLGSLLGQLQDEMGPLAQDKGLSLIVSENDWRVRSDATFLRRILQNLISNAIRYTDKGEVEVTSRAQSGHIEVKIRDTGPGIPEDQHEKIFDEFHRIENSANAVDGLGLGLAIVERACRLLNHPLALTSDAVTGTTFAIRLPLSVTFAHQSLKDPTPESPVLAHCIILLIENDEELRSALSLTLESWGTDVLPCASGEEALTLLREIDIAPDLILADYQLAAGELGTDVIKSLHANYGPIPACVVTADHTAPISRTCAEIGAALLHKPIDPKALRSFVVKASSFRKDILPGK